MLDDFLQKIKDLSLSKTDKLIADYLVDHQNAFGVQTATTLALEIGVSDTSIIRFVRKMGFSGYSDFKRQMNDQMMRQYHEALSPGEKYLRTKGTFDQSNLISDVMGRVTENLYQSCERLDVETIDRVASVLIRSQRKFVVGFRGTSCCALYMWRKLLFFLPDVICCIDAESAAIERLADIGSEDCLFLYSFPRHTELNRTLLDMARGSGATIILMTDRITSPLASDADIVLAAAVEGLGFTNSYVVPLCISEMLVLAVSERMGAQGSERLRKIEGYIDKNHMY